MSTPVKRLCPVCGAKMRIAERGVEGSYLTCTECPLDWGWNWFDSEKELLAAWDDAPNRKKTNGRTRPKPVVKIDRDGKVLERYRSLSEAAKKNPMSKTAIKNRTERKLRGEFSGFDYTFRLEADMKGMN